jgi:hypothetical protein
MGLEYGESQHTELNVDTVCEAAVDRTRLDDFGSDDFRERLEVQLAEMNADTERTGLGRMLWFSDCERVIGTLRHDRVKRPFSSMSSLGNDTRWMRRRRPGPVYRSLGADFVGAKTATTTPNTR